MKKSKQTSGKTIKCAERDRLWAAFLQVGRQWGSIQDKMRRTLKRKGIFKPDTAQLEHIKNRLERTHKLFGEHIDKHGCWQPRVPALRKRKQVRKSGN